MTKLLLIVGVTILIVYLLKRSARGGKGDAAVPKPGREAEDMVRCRVCGVNLPRSEALMSRGQVYCCEEHRQKDA